jgi:hypothetical protein
MKEFGGLPIKAESGEFKVLIVLALLISTNRVVFVKYRKSCCTEELDRRIL